MDGAVCTLRSTLIAVASAAVAVQAVARAEPSNRDGPAPPAVRYLTLTHLDAYLEFKTDYTHRVVDRSGRGRFERDRRQRNRESGVEERIGLKLGGVVLDPGFLTFGGEFSFALTQDRFEEKSDFSFDLVDRDNGYLLQYDLRANLFPGKRLSGSVYGLRQEDRINRRFQPTLKQRRMGFGTSWVLAPAEVPMEISYDYLETDRTGNANPQDDEHFAESTFRYNAEWAVSEHQKLEFSYEHAKTRQEYQGLDRPFETTRDLLTLDHVLDLGADRKHELRTRLHWQEESGDFARDFFEIGPQLTLHHSDTLQSIYKYQFNRERYQGLDVETQRLDFQVVHQMYTNLTTTLNVFALYEDVEDDINTTQYGTSVDWQYNRRNRFGHLYANLALAYDTEDVDGDNGTRVILDEAQTFRDPLAVALRNRNVVPGSVVVTDTSNRRIFQPGLDYLITTRGNVTRLSRMRTGRISDADTVLVDYLITTPTDGQLDTMRVDLSIEQRFTGGMTPYYRLSYRNQEDDGSTGFLRRADRTNHHRMGVRYEAQRYSLGIEYEVFDDTVDPFDAFHANGLLHVLQSPDHSLNASTRLSRLFFEGGVDRRNVTMIDVELDHRWRLSDSWSTVERAAFRFEDDSVAGITRSWDLSAGLEYAVGDLSGEVTLEYDRLQLPHSEENNFGVYFRVRRELSHVLR